MDLRAWLAGNGLYAAFVLAGAAIAVFAVFRVSKSRRKNEPYSFMDHVMGARLWDRVLRVDESDPEKAARLRRRVMIGWILVLALFLLAVTFDL